MFKLMSRYGNDLAFIVVATKKDNLVAIEEARSLNRLRGQNRPLDAKPKRRQNRTPIKCSRIDLGVLVVGRNYNGWNKLAHHWFRDV